MAMGRLIAISSERVAGRRVAPSYCAEERRTNRGLARIHCHFGCHLRLGRRNRRRAAAGELSVKMQVKNKYKIAFKTRENWINEIT